MATLSQLSHCLHPINVFEDVGALRRSVARLAVGQGGVRTGEAELVATELGTNLLRHAVPGGYVLYRQAADGIELLAVDTGPGMAALRASGAGVADIGTENGGLSAGLPTIRRMATAYDCHSSPAGTIVFARLGGGPAPSGGPWRHGGVNIPLGGAGPSGDAFAVIADQRLAVLVVDGLGHGDDAAAAAWAAVELFNQGPGTDPADFLRRANTAMRGTRGGVAAMCVIDPDVGQLAFAGIGNIAGQFVCGCSKQHLVSHGGTLGTQLTAPSIRVRHYPWSPGSTLIMSTDGIREGWNLSAYPGLLERDPAVIAAGLHRDFTRSTDDAAVLVVRDMSS